MRVHVTLSTDKYLSIPVNYQEYLTAAVYGYVDAGDASYGKFVHDEGYVAEGGKRFKPFTYSGLRISAGRRRIQGDRLIIAPGVFGWVVASPLDDFLRPFASGLVQAASLRIGQESVNVVGVEALGKPEIDGPTRMICLSPIVASIRRPDGGTQYLRPLDGPEAFSEAIRSNLIARYAALFGKPASDTDLNIVFDDKYLRANRGGTKKQTYKGIDIVGILAPFTMTGSKELIDLGYEGGLGGKTACGFGCVEVWGVK